MRLLIILLLAAHLVAGCATEDRCPADEVCSDLTPDGLYFVGSDYSDGWLGAGGVNLTASGGAQTLRVVMDESVDSLAYSGPFDAATSGVFAVGDNRPPEVTVSATVTGSGMLRILEPNTDLLLDRVSLTAAPVARVELAIMPLTLDAGLLGGDPWALYAGGEQRIVVQLYNAGDVRLVDELMTVGAADLGVTSDQDEWDRVGLGGLTAPAAELAIHTGAGDEFNATVAVVAELDTVLLIGRDDLEPDIQVGTSSLLCFRGERDGLVAIGLDWTFTVTGPAMVESSSFDNCAMVHATELGNASVTVGAAGLGTTIDVHVVESPVDDPYGGDY